MPTSESLWQKEIFRTRSCKQFSDAWAIFVHIRDSVSSCGHLHVINLWNTFRISSPHCKPWIIRRKKLITWVKYEVYGTLQFVDDAACHGQERCLEFHYLKMPQKWLNFSEHDNLAKLERNLQIAAPFPLLRFRYFCIKSSYISISELNIQFKKRTGN